MENIINTNIFIDYLVFYLKIVMHTHKGTEHLDILETCVKTCNKFKQIQAVDKKDDSIHSFIRKCYKRINLVLKVNDDSTAVNLRDNQNQLRLPFLSAHEAIISDNVESMFEYSLENKIDIIVGVPLVFTIQESKHRELIWQYTRALFYISNYLTSRVNSILLPANRTEDELIAIRKSNIDEATKKLEVILTDIADIEEDCNINTILSTDKFLNAKIIKDNNKNGINKAKFEVKKMFKKRGLTKNSVVNKMVDSITDKLQNIDFEKGNIVECVMGISQEITATMRPEIEKDKSCIGETVSAVVDIFREIVENPENDEEDIPADLKDMFKNIISILPDSNKEMTDEDITSAMSVLAESKGINIETLIKESVGENGEVNIPSLQNLMGLSSVLSG